MTTNEITTRAQYIGLFASPGEAIEYENQALSIGREFLPACARAVLGDRDKEPGADYWRWLASQVQEMRQEQAQENDGVDLDGYTITVEHIQALEAEALKAGDGGMVDICQLALKQRRNGQWEAGDIKASAACARAINAAQGDGGNARALRERSTTGARMASAATRPETFSSATTPANAVLRSPVVTASHCSDCPSDYGSRAGPMEV